jgi:hypothetical protein
MREQRVRVKGVRRKEVDADRYALALWLLARRRVAEKHERSGKAPNETAGKGASNGRG